MPWTPQAYDACFVPLLLREDPYAFRGHGRWQKKLFFAQCERMCALRKKAARTSVTRKLRANSPSLKGHSPTRSLVGTGRSIPQGAWCFYREQTSRPLSNFAPTPHKVAPAPGLVEAAGVLNSGRRSVAAVSST